MKRRRSLPRRSNAPASIDGGVLPPLATALATRLTTTADSGELQRTVSHLRAVARHAQPSNKPIQTKPHAMGAATAVKQSPRSLVQLKPLARFPVPSVTKSSSNNDDREEDHVLAEIWRVAATTAKQHSDKARQSPVVESNNRGVERPQETPPPDTNDELGSAQGTTLARYRRLVGIHARKTLATILAEASTRVAQRRLEDSSSVSIQRLARRFLGRRRRERILYHHVVAAETLQCCWRQVVARRQLQVARQEEQARRRVAQRRVAAALTIQRAFRRHVVRRQMMRLEALRRRHVEIRSRRLLARAMSTWRRREKESRASRSNPLPGRCGMVDCESRDQPLPLLNELDALASPEEMDHRQAECSMELSHIITTGEVSSFVDAFACNALTAVADQAPNVSCEHTCPKRSKCSIRDFTETNDTSTHEIGWRVESSRNEARFCDGSSLSDREMAVVTNAGCEAPLSAIAARVLPPSLPVLEPSPLSPRNDRKHMDTINSPSPSLKMIEESGVETSELFCATAETAESASGDGGLSTLAVRRATRAIAHFFISRCLPIARSHLAIAHSAATRIQQLVRQRLARQQVAFHRQLHVVALRSELQADWLRSERQLLAMVLGFEPTEADHERDAALRNSFRVDHDGDEDDEDFVFDDGDDEGGHGMTAGPTWAEVLPTRSGHIPPGLRQDFTRGGPVDRKAPSLGLWKWSWASEQWESKVDLFRQLHIVQNGTKGK